MSTVCGFQLSHFCFFLDVLLWYVMEVLAMAEFKVIATLSLKSALF